MAVRLCPTKSGVDVREWEYRRLDVHQSWRVCQNNSLGDITHDGVYAYSISTQNALSPINFDEQINFLPRK